MSIKNKLVEAHNKIVEAENKRKEHSEKADLEFKAKVEQFETKLTSIVLPSLKDFEADLKGLGYDASISDVIQKTTPATQHPTVKYWRLTASQFGKTLTVDITCNKPTQEIILHANTRPQPETNILKGERITMSNIEAFMLQSFQNVFR